MFAVDLSSGCAPRRCVSWEHNRCQSERQGPPPSIARWMRTAKDPAEWRLVVIFVSRLEFFTVAEVAERLGVSTSTIRRWIENLELVAHRFGRAVRIAECDLKAFLAMHRDG